MTNAITLTNGGAVYDVILAPSLEAQLDTSGRRAVKSRLAAFAYWLDKTGRGWQSPDLAAYAAQMQADGLAASTIAAHLSTIRARYIGSKRGGAVPGLLQDNTLRQHMLDQAPGSPADRRAFVEELHTRIKNALVVPGGAIRAVKAQDTADNHGTRLTPQQAAALLAAPGVHTLAGLRDTAIIALMLATGARAAEVAALVDDDYKQTLGGAPALLVRDGKGGKSRVVPYGGMDYVIAIVDAWRNRAGITSGPVFRGLYKGGRTVRKTAITTVAIEHILARYPVSIGGELTTITPHDLRRTYAKLAYLAGMDTLAIKDNLGHSDVKTTLRYIGTMDSTARQPGALVAFDVAGLKSAGMYRHRVR